MSTSALLENITSTVTGNSIQCEATNRTYQATVTGTGAVSATVVIEVCNDNANWLTLGTITLSGTTSASDGFAATANWQRMRGRVSAISGTGATVNCTASF